MRFGKLMGLGGGHVALQLLLTIEKGPFKFQSSEPFFKVNTTTNGNIKISTRCILGKYEV